MKSNRVEEAAALATRIGKAIARVDKKYLSGANSCNNTKELWKRVNQLTKKSPGLQPAANITAADLNSHYASISTDPEYQEPQLRNTVYQDTQLLTEQSTFYTLDHLKCTAEGWDQVPAWFLRLLAPIYAQPLAHLINRSVSLAHVPTQWKTALITPIPKVPAPTSSSDYRPLSVVPILSRIVERAIVRANIYPEFCRSPMSVELTDQFAFRPTGSTTVAIITILFYIT